MVCITWPFNFLEPTHCMLIILVGYGGNELNGITHENCEKLLDMMKDRRHIFKKDNKFDYTFLYNILLEAQLPNRKEEIEELVEPYCGE